jgi:hypothetical protein
MSAEAWRSFPNECEACGADYWPSPIERPHHFSARRYCSLSCASAQVSASKMLALCTLNEVADALGISYESARLAEKSGLKKIKKYLTKGEKR